MLNHPIVRGAFLMALLGLALIAHQRYRPRPHAARQGAPTLTAANEHREPAASHSPPLRVLMIGNSHSAPLPKLLTLMAAAAGLNVQAHGATPGGKTLQFHATAPETLQSLRARPYDVVTLQDQGQVAAYAESIRAQRFYPPGTQLTAAVRAVGAEPWLYAVYARPDGDLQNWPGDTYEAMQDRSDQGYAELSRRTEARVIPVGRAFRNARALAPHLPLWNPDGIHASPHGYYLAAAVFFAALLQRDPSDVPFDAGLPAADAAFLRRTASNVVQAATP